jgi:hypothetical protein
MDLEKFLISAMIFLFVVFLTPGFIDSVATVSASEPLYPVLQIMPTAFLAIAGLFPVYFGLKEG